MAQDFSEGECLAIEKSSRRIVAWGVAAGSCLTLLLIFGLTYPVRGLLFSFWLAHLLCLFLALFHGVSSLCALAKRDRRGCLFLLLLLASFVFIALQGQLPPTARDALIYHLAVPKAWLEAGMIEEMEWNKLAYFPLEVSLAYGGFLAIGAEKLCANYHALYLLLCAALGALLTARVTRSALLGLATATLICLMPLCIRLATEPMADLALAFFFGAAMVEAFRSNPEKDRCGDILAGMSLGLAMSCKYTCLLAVALLPFAFVGMLLRERTSGREIVVRSVLIASGALALFLPWGIKNYFWIGDPFYPFGSNLVSESSEYEFVGAIPPLLYRHLVYHESWLEVVFVPLRMFLFGADGSTQSFDGVITPLLLFGLAAPFWRGKDDDKRWILPALILVSVHIVLAPMFHHLLTRYHAPFLVVGASLATIGIAWAISLTRYQRLVIALLLGGQLAVSVAYASQLWRRSETTQFLFGGETREHYLANHLDEYSLAELVNERLDSDSKVLLLFTGNRFYLYDKRAEGEYFADRQIVKWLSESGSGSEMCERITASGFTHLGIHDRRFAQSFQSKLREKPELTPIWQQFAKENLIRIDTRHGLSLWKIHCKEGKDLSSTPVRQ